MLRVAAMLAMEGFMPVWVCARCKHELDARCRPASCPKCGAAKEELGKKEEGATPPKRCCC
jgi:rubrerythrin